MACFRSVAVAVRSQGVLGRIQSLLWVVAFSVLALSGCQTVNPRSAEVAKEPPGFTGASDYDHDEKVRDFQALLKSKGLYLNTSGTVVLEDKPGECPIELQAHRGDYRYAENTTSSIAAALRNGFDAVEIDVQRLADGLWVVFHDERTGRAAVFMNGAKLQIGILTTKQFSQLRMRGPDGTLTGNRPNTAREIFRVFAREAKPHQVLNIEVKSDVTTGDLEALDRLVRKYIDPSQYSYSSMSLDTLQTLRAINPHVYLGLIQKPEPESVRILKGQLQKAVSGDQMYQSRSRLVDMYADYRSRHYSRKHADYTSSVQLAKIKRVLGANAGLHLDIRRFAQTPNVRLRAKVAGLKKIATYSINGEKYHQKLLTYLAKRSKAPDAAIVDETVYSVCRRTYPYKGPPDGIPDDIDFQTLQAQPAYLDNGMYMKLSGEVGYWRKGPVQGASSVPSRSSAHMVLPDAPKDRAIDLKPSGPVTIDLKR